MDPLDPPVQFPTIGKVCSREALRMTTCLVLLLSWMGTVFFLQFNLVPMLSCSVVLFVSPPTIAHQARLFKGSPGQEYWSKLPFPPPWHPNPGITPVSPESPALACRVFPTGPPVKPCSFI